LFDETVQFIRNCEHCCSAASCGCGIFQSLPCCWLSYTSICPQVHTCSLWNISCTSCASNTLLRRCGSMFGFRSSCSMSDADWCYDDSLRHCSTVCKVATSRLLQTKIALSHLEHCPNSMDSATNTATPFLSLLLTHHFLVMDVDCYLTCTSVIPAIIWFIVLALGLFKSPFHICVRHTN